MQDSREITKIVRNMELFKNLQNKTGNSLNEIELLRFVSKHPGCYASNIVAYLNVDKSLVSRMIQKLYKHGYIELKSTNEDKRMKEIYPTNKTIELKETAFMEEYQFYSCVLSALTKEEQETYLDLTHKVYVKSKQLRKSGFTEIYEKKSS